MDLAFIGMVEGAYKITYSCPFSYRLKGLFIYTVAGPGDDTLRRVSRG